MKFDKMLQGSLTWTVRGILNSGCDAWLQGTQRRMEKKWKEKMQDIATTTFMRSCDAIEGKALRNITISRAKLVQIVEQSRVLCEDYVYCRLLV